MNKTKQVEKRVLKTYRKVDPSTHVIEKGDIFKYHQEFRESLFRDKLKFPLKMFSGAELLDFGSGTGERDIFYAQWGANVTGVEMNSLSVARCRKLFKKYGLEDKLTIHSQSLFDFESDKKFDIVVANGVLHHTNNQKMGFEKLASYLKSGGYLFISQGNNAGAFQRNLQRLILYKFAKSEKEISKLAKFLFKDHIDRAVKYGKRTAESVVYDSYVVPKADNASVEEIMEWFAENDVKFYSSWPPIQFPFALADSPRNRMIDFTSVEYRDCLSFSEYAWMTANKIDKEVIQDSKAGLSIMNRLNEMAGMIKDIVPTAKLNLDTLKDSYQDFHKGIIDIQIKKAGCLRQFFEELAGLIELLKSTKNPKAIKKRIDSCKILFRGYCGQGEIYYMGYKK